MRARDLTWRSIRRRCGKGPHGGVGNRAPRGPLPQRAGHLYVRAHSQMSRAAANFDNAIGDALILLAYFDSNHKQSPDHAEVLKRAGLVMALTAWETYVEDRAREAVQARLKILNGSPVGKFVLAKLEDEIKRFHNPGAEKTKRLFFDYLEVDVTEGWTWQNMDPALARKTLDDLISKRGDAVHRAKPATGGPPAPHLVKRDDLEKAIRFMKNLVQATDQTLDGQ